MQSPFFFKSLAFELSCNCPQLLACGSECKGQEFISILITISHNYPKESRINPFQQTRELSSHIIELLWILYIIPERM